jgi:Tol biopolymer transport system component
LFPSQEANKMAAYQIHKTIKATIALCLLCHSVFAQPPKGKVIFASKIADGDFYQLYSINSDGTGEYQLTFANKDADLPSVYKDMIVYRQTEDSKSGACDFMAIGTNGGSSHSLFADGAACYPRWKPDGTLIAFESFTKDSKQEIWVIDSNGNNKRRLIKNAWHPCWSRDNKKIAFTRDYEIWTMDLKSKAQQQLTHVKQEGILVKWPALSPDGKQLACVAFYNGKAALFIIDLLRGGDPKIIENCSGASWTNDPNYLVCSYNTKYQPSQIILLNTRTGEKTYVTNNDHPNYFPAWSSAE